MTKHSTVTSYGLSPHFPITSANQLCTLVQNYACMHTYMHTLVIVSSLALLTIIIGIMVDVEPWPATRAPPAH